MKFTDPQGRSLEVNSPDGSTPSEQELDQMFSMKYGNVATSPKASESIMTQGLGYVQQHPFKTVLQPLAQTLGGKSMQDMALEASKQNVLEPPAQAPFDSNIMAASTPLARFNAQGNQAAAGMMGSVADMVTTPANYLMAPLMKPLGAGIEAMGNTLSKIPTVLNSGKGAQFANTVQQAFLNVKKAAVDKFGGQLETLTKNNPDKTVDLGNVVNDIKQNWGDLSNNAKAAFKRTPVLRDLLKNTSDVTADTVPVSLEDTQKIINHLNNSIPASIKAKDLDLMHTLYDIRGTQLDAFPEMAEARQGYQSVIDPYNKVKSYFRFNKTLNAIQNDFGGSQGVEAVKSLGLPESIINEMGGYKSAVKFIKNAKRSLIPLGIAAVGGRTAGAVIKGLGHE